MSKKLYAAIGGIEDFTEGTIALLDEISWEQFTRQRNVLGYWVPIPDRLVAEINRGLEVRRHWTQPMSYIYYLWSDHDHTLTGTQTRVVKRRRELTDYCLNELVDEKRACAFKGRV